MMRVAGMWLLILLSCNVAWTEESRPNILFCIADDASYPHMSAYGCSWVKTPGFDRIAEAGLLFQHAYTPNAKCAPSRACILTGRNPWQLKAACNHWCYFPPEFKTYPEVLADHGYFVGSTAKGWAPGIAKDEEGKPRELAGPAFNKRRMSPPAKGISNIDYAGNFEEFLQAKPEEQPFCFWYGGLEPHRAYEYQAGINKAGKKLTDIDRVPSFWPDNETVRTDLLDYAYEIEYFDQHLVRMLDLLEKRGELDNTIVVVTADNGMPFPRVKGQEYEMSNHLPLAIMWKQGIKQPGRVIEDYISFIDFAPTFIEVAQLDWEETAMQPTPGRSLTDIFRSEESGQVNPERDYVLIGKERHDIGRPNDAGYPIRGILRDGILYLQNFEPERWPAGNPETGYLNCDGSPTKTEVLAARTKKTDVPYWMLSFGKRPVVEMYNVKQDPECMKNLAADDEHQLLATRLRSQLYQALKRQSDPRILGNGNVFDEYPYADQKTQNFYQRYQNGEKLPAGWVNPTDFDQVIPTQQK